jgi:perosamine synthetase
MTHLDELAAVAQKHEIPLIEDCCESIGGSLGGRPAGSFGRAGVFGFYPNKQITTGEGGMIVTSDDRLADLCRSLRNQGRDDEAVMGHGMDGSGSSTTGSSLSHVRLGYNYRLSEIAAALGIAQMERLDEILERRREIASLYMRRLMDWEELILPDIEADRVERMSWFVFVVRLNDLYGAVERDRIISGLRRHEVGAAAYFPCIHLQPFYRRQFGFSQGDMPVAESVAERTIALPFYNTLDETCIDLICQTLRVMVDRENLLKRD